MTLGKRIAYLRCQKKLTQDELSKALGISRGSLSMYEIDRREPDNNTLVKVADYFNVSTDYLFDRTDNPKPISELQDSILETNASYNFELPKEAIKQIEDYIEFIKQRYK
ncbi:MAG: helix-turn-helix domain-containing protein [Clostridia bacterium]